MALPLSRPRGLDARWVPTLIKVMSRCQVWLYRRTGGRVGGTWRVGAALRKPVPVLLLHHVGRRSGRRFTTPLLYLDLDPELVVVASRGGLPHHPQWFHNLRARPDTEVQVGREARSVRARVATDRERDALWPRLDALYADFAAYRNWTDREIPVLLLEPRPAGDR